MITSRANSRTGKIVSREFSKIVTQKFYNQSFEIFKNFFEFLEYPRFQNYLFTAYNRILFTFNPLFFEVFHNDIKLELFKITPKNNYHPNLVNLKIITKNLFNLN